MNVKSLCSLYGLNAKKIKKFSEGKINETFECITSEGNYVIQVLRKELNPWTKNKIKLRNMLLHFLKNKGFPYEIPVPLRNKMGDYFTQIGEKSFCWIYKKSPEEHTRNMILINLKKPQKQ